jgi:hypothetical protein
MYWDIPMLLLLQVTGIASTADYLEYLPGADEFRKHAPGCATPADSHNSSSSKQQSCLASTS